MSCQGHFDILILFASTGHFDDMVLGDIFGGKTVTHRYLVFYCFASETTVAIALMTGLLWTSAALYLLLVAMSFSFQIRQYGNSSIERVCAMRTTIAMVDITAWHIAVHQAI